MLRVVGLRDGTGRYYLDDPAHEIAWLTREGGADGAGRWWGPSAARLGLDGAVATAAFAAVLDGRLPDSGRALRGPTRSTSAFDLTFAAPKSVSAAYALADPAVAATVVDAHRAAVSAAMEYVDVRAAAVRRRSGGERRLEPVDGVVAAAFTHGTSRALDPHLHTHVVVANVAHGRDGRWSALDGRGLHAHAPAAGALYDAHLRRLLAERLGATWSLRPTGAYELDVVDPATIGALSSRQAEIAEWRHRRGSHTSSATARVVTRDAKSAPRTPELLRARWARSADAVGFNQAALAHRLGTQRAKGVGDGLTHVEVDEYRFAALLGRTWHAAPTRRDVVAAWAGALQGGGCARDLERSVDMLAPWSSAVGVGEQPVALGHVVPGRLALGMLGPRPATPDKLEIWHDAAASIDRYKGRWLADTTELRRSMHATSAEMSRMPARQLAEHLSVTRHIAEARLRLGREHGRGVSVPDRGLGRC